MHTACNDIPKIKTEGTTDSLIAIDHPFSDTPTLSGAKREEKWPALQQWMRAFRSRCL